MTDLEMIRDAMIESLPVKPFNSGIPLEPREFYIPSAHIKALRLYSSIIVGGRGTGKSTWTSAFSSEQLRSIIGANIPELENINVFIGFSEKSDLSRIVFKNLMTKKFEPYEIWQTVIWRWLTVITGDSIDTDNWETNVSRVREDPESWLKLIQKADNCFKRNNNHGLILFDALDRSGDTWETMDEILRDLLRLVMELTAYSNIHAKVFLREDQFSRNRVTSFPDASKLLTTKIELDWHLHDLHGLLWHYLCNAEGEKGMFLRSLYKDALGSEPISHDNYWTIEDKVKLDEQKQRSLFERLAGPWMGRDKRRGVPYIWSVGHLADGKGRTSPRSFLAGILEATENSKNSKGEYPLYYEGIKRGVQKASEIRIGELKEDYPWINDVCNLLRGLNVPVEFALIEERWHKEYPDGPQSIKSDQLPPQEADGGWTGIRKELVRLGIFVDMQDGRINMPDLYRVGFGLGRRGGVVPLS